MNNSLLAPPVFGTNFMTSGFIRERKKERGRNGEGERELEREGERQRQIETERETEREIKRDRERACLRPTAGI
jgi:hypothetical protein